MNIIKFVVVFLSFSIFTQAAEFNSSYYQKIFENRDGCFLAVDSKTSKVLAQYNSERCKIRFPPCSTFKPIVAFMSFEKGILKNENSILKWDGTNYPRKELNQNQTPMTWMSNSVNWANEQMINRLGNDAVQDLLNDINYGNRDFSQGESPHIKDLTIDKAVLKISAEEQVRVLTDLWLEKLKASKRSHELTRKILFVETVGEKTKLYGKTGSCCIDPGCDRGIKGRQLAWFVGAIENGKGGAPVIFAVNFSDRLPSSGYGGAIARTIAKQILKELGLIH